MPFAPANSTALDPFNNSKTTDDFRLVVERLPFFDRGPGKASSFHKPKFTEKISISYGGPDEFDFARGLK
jgi:hypothetical protein